MCSLGVSYQMEDVTTKGRSIAVCVWLVMVGIAAGQRGICRFTPDTSSLSCSCVPNVGQSLHLHSLRRPIDVCLKGNGDRLCCRNSSQAWVDASHVKLIYSWAMNHTVYCEFGFGFGLSDVECSGQGTMATQMSNSPLMNSRKPVSSRMGGWDGRKMLNSTNAAGRSVAQVTMAVGVPIVLWCLWVGRLKTQILAWMEMHSEIPLSAVLLPALAAPPRLQRNPAQSVQSLPRTNTPPRQSPGESPLHTGDPSLGSTDPLVNGIGPLHKIKLRTPVLLVNTYLGLSQSFLPHSHHISCYHIMPEVPCG
ncbi:uncharacterized protein LOC132385349 isoform X1 [Hypanus sabinus]|uniref:uncharacterized protein LOC132385349 isoform X1 n=1 Tax=Hypanus sabinus TaxID=79690 RepID=UPI0028C45297|nr:uncharacterized protein LOC132385349 isoform X1 [Hypanus sabinus]